MRNSTNLHSISIQRENKPIYTTTEKHSMLASVLKTLLLIFIVFLVVSTFLFLNYYGDFSRMGENYSEYSILKLEINHDKNADGAYKILYKDDTGKTAVDYVEKQDVYKDNIFKSPYIREYYTEGTAEIFTGSGFVPLTSPDGVSVHLPFYYNLPK